MKPAKRSRSYELPSHANAGKDAAIRALLPVWQRGLVHVQLVQSRRMRAGEKLGFLDTKNLPPYLSQRQWKSVVNQVNTALRSWQELATIAMREHISALPGLSVDERRGLYRLNLCHEWWGHPALEPMLVRLMRTRLPLPNLSRVRTMLMDGPIAQLETPTNPTPAHDTWARISLTPGTKPVRIPLGINPYEADATGERARFLQIIIPEHGRVTFRVVRHSTPAPARTTGSALGMDWGLASLAVTSDGRRYGQALYAWLKKRDSELDTLARALQRQGIRLKDSRRYRNLTRRIREHVRNEVGRILNTITRGDVRELVVEDIDFRYGGLSKRLNRILNRAGRAAFKNKLAALSEDTGITITKVHAAYSSQECSGCGYVSRTNRTTQAVFRCGFCHKTLHADINAARTIQARRSGLRAEQPMSRATVLTHLDQSFHARWGVDAGRVRERHARPHSRAPRYQPSGQGELTLSG